MRWPYFSAHWWPLVKGNTEEEACDGAQGLLRTVIEPQVDVEHADGMMRERYFAQCVWDLCVESLPRLCHPCVHNLPRLCHLCVQTLPSACGTYVWKVCPA